MAEYRFNPATELTLEQVTALFKELLVKQLTRGEYEEVIARQPELAGVFEEVMRK